MKKLLLVGLFLFVSISVGVDPSGASAQADRRFDAFLAKFKDALAKGDKESVASMTKLPFLFESKERDRAGFIKIFDGLFTAPVKKCFVTAKPVKEGDLYDIFCAKKIFYFGIIGGEYKFTEFAVDY
jgi:hypothetical protein